jgi:uncharacterized membrane protein YccC
VFTEVLIETNRWVTPTTSPFFRDVTHIDRSAFSLSIGLRAAVVVTAPMVVGFAINEEALIFATLGAVWFTSTEGQPSLLPWWVLFVACFTEAAAFGLGTLAATTGLSPLLLALFLSLALLARGSTRWTTTGTYTAISFAVGAGLPGPSVDEAALRLSLSLFGAVLALGGAELHRFVQSQRRPTKRKVVPSLPSQQISRREAVRSAIVLGIVSAVGFSIGLALGLPRDFWVVVTILVSVRPNLRLTVSFTSMMAFGTIIGAFIAAAITLETSNQYVLLPLLFAFAFMMLALRGVNFGLVQVFITPFIIILVNILYPGEWYLAFYRIFEVGIAVVLAILAVYLLSVRRRATEPESGNRRSSLGP